MFHWMFFSAVTVNDVFFVSYVNKILLYSSLAVFRHIFLQICVGYSVQVNNKSDFEEKQKSKLAEEYTLEVI